MRTAAAPLSGALTAALLTARLALSAARGALWTQVNDGRVDGYTDTDNRNIIAAGAAAGAGVNRVRRMPEGAQVD